MKRSFAWLAVSKLVGLGCGFVSAVLVNHSLEPETRGRLAHLQTSATGFSVGMGLSLETSTYHIANPALYQQDARDKAATLLVVSASLAFFCGGLIGLAVWLSPAWLAPLRPWLPPLIVCSAAQIIQNHVSVFLQAGGRLLPVARVLTLQATFGALLLGGLFLRQQLSFSSAVWIWAIRQVLGAVLMLLLMPGQGALTGRFSWSLARRLVSTGLQMHLSTMAAFVYTGMNQVTLAYYCGEQDAGYYAVALTLVSAAMLVPEAALQVLYPRVIYHQDEVQVTLRILRWGLLGWGLGVALLGAFAQPLLQLYGGAKFLPSIQPFLLLLPMLWFLPLSSFTAPYLVKVGAFRMMTVSALMMGALSVLLNLRWIPAYSYNGAALANSVCALVGFGVCWIQLGICCGWRFLRPNGMN